MRKRVSIRAPGTGERRLDACTGGRGTPTLPVAILQQQQQYMTLINTYTVHQQHQHQHTHIDHVGDHVAPLAYAYYAVLLLFSLVAMH